MNKESDAAYVERVHKEQAEAAAVESAKADTVVGSITATNLNAMYQQNEVDADNEVKGKRIIVVGRISRIRKDFNDEAHVELATGQMFEHVDCKVTNAAASGLKRGQGIQIEGHVTGMIVNTVMVDATY